MSKYPQISVFLLLVLLFLTACSEFGVEIVATVSPTLEPTREALTLPPTSPNIANGQILYAENCTRCHGDNGSGDGELVASGQVPRMPSFLEASHVREQSLDFYYDIISNGNLINLMPNWNQALSVQERWDVALYVYTLHYQAEQIARGAELAADSPRSEFSLQSDSELASATGLEGEDAWALVAHQRLTSLESSPIEPTPSFSMMSFTGTVSNGTAGGTVPADLLITMGYGNQEVGVLTLQATLDSENRYRFDNVPFVADYGYLIVTEHRGMNFRTDFVAVGDLSAENSLDLTIYEPVNTPNVVELERIDLTIERLTVDGLGTGLVFNQINTYNNKSDRVYSLTPEGQAVSVSLLMELPAGSQILNDPNNPRYLIAQEQFSLVDTSPVFPGKHQMEALYFVPYEEAATIDLPLTNVFNGRLTIYLAADTLSITGENLSAVGEVNLGIAENPLMAQQYQGDYSLRSGQSILFDLEGSLAPSFLNAENDTSLSMTQLVPILLLVIGLIIALLGGIVWFLRRTNSSSQAEINRLLHEIAELEALHNGGQLNHDAFQRQRQALKTQLAALMPEQKT